MAQRSRPPISSGLSGVGAGRGLVSRRGSPRGWDRCPPFLPSSFPPPARVSSQPVLSSWGHKCVCAEPWRGLKCHTARARGARRVENNSPRAQSAHCSSHLHYAALQPRARFATALPAVGRARARAHTHKHTEEFAPAKAGGLLQALPGAWRSPGEAASAGVGVERARSELLSPADRSPRRAALACSAEDTCAGGTGSLPLPQERLERPLPAPCHSRTPPGPERELRSPAPRFLACPAVRAKWANSAAPTLTTPVPRPWPPPSPVLLALHRHRKGLKTCQPFGAGSPLGAEPRG
ncbi:PREDICTED: putative DNA helicase ino80 [Chinchilla lanigera]|uniref:putative DNA helicase ino80 n=1 Tax=Chinchilla lanigera TaxID=34839 RepID=UPI000697A503|nr:PREDICTED: putative DNA helicase ino80 [Chinchilla lanigera]